MLPATAGAGGRLFAVLCKKIRPSLEVGLTGFVYAQHGHELMR
ncbi:MAG: hypothetical protein OFPII_30810 [Osedax symbiont Rs1]|nr:MAG: hypothetical protein OFPII_30810 [Osedax symbiont Rs1]